MKTRKYSDEFIDKEIAKIDKIYEETHTYYPSGHDLSERPWQEKELREYVNHRAKLSYIQGFWYGWSLRNGLND